MALPDINQMAVDAGVFPDADRAERLQEAFLPSDLLVTDGAWVPMGRAHRPIAMAHEEGFPFFGRSVFLVFLRSPDGRMTMMDLIAAPNADSSTQRPVGTEVALVRRMLLNNDGGDLRLSPLTEAIQLRHLEFRQNSYEFELNSSLLLSGKEGGFHLKREIFLLFFGHGDVFQAHHGPNLQPRIPVICNACHFESPPVPNAQSILGNSRGNFPLPDGQRPILCASTWEEEGGMVIGWKRAHPCWGSLKALWRAQP